MEPELMGHTSIPHNWEEYIFDRGCSCDVQSILGSGLIPSGRKTTKPDILILSRKIQTKKTPSIIQRFLRKCIITVLGNAIKMPSVGKNIQSTRSRIATLAKKVICDHHP